MSLRHDYVAVVVMSYICCRELSRYCGMRKFCVALTLLGRCVMSILLRVVSDIVKWDCLLCL